MIGQQSFVIGRDAGEHLKVTVICRSHGGCQDFWDGNWVDADVSVQVGGFVGGVRAYLRTDEIEQFRDQLGRLYDSLDGNAEFTSMEHWLSAQITGDGIGHFNARCELSDDPGSPNRLMFELAFDQTDLPPMLAQLESILQEFPVIGNRGS